MTEVEDISLARRPFRGLIQSVLVIAGALMVTGICWCIWALIAHWRLQAEIEAITALHEPLLPRDFAVAPVPDDRNAALLWRNVFAALPANDDSPSNSNLSYSDYPPYPPQWHQKEDKSIIVNAKLLDLAHIAASANDADWGEASRSPHGSASFLMPARATANVLGDAMVHAHVHGNDALAIERACDLIHLGKAEGEAGPIIARLVSIGIVALSTHRLVEITPDLVIGSEPSIQDIEIAGGVPRERVQALIRLLLEETNERKLRVTSVDFERMAYYTVLTDEKKFRWTLRPLIELSEVRMFEQRKVDRLAAGALSEADAINAYKSHPEASMIPRTISLGSLAAPATSVDWADACDEVWMETCFRPIETEWKGIANRRTAAVALAIRLYRHDHNDAWPKGLADLVPAYLPSIPSDPFQPGQTPIGYVIRKNALPDGSDRPLLYFNLSGDPKTVVIPPTPCFDWTWSRGADGPQWRDLSRWYPAVAPNTSSPGQGPMGSTPQTGNH